MPKSTIKDVAAKPSYLMPWEFFSTKKKIIGIIDPCYGSSHVIYPCNLESIVHKRVPKINLEFLDKISTFNKFTPYILNATVDLLHTWNSIPRNKDFIVSFELELPRYLGSPTKKQITYGLDILASDRCKAIAALSDFAAENAKRFFNSYGYHELNKKLTVLRGTVPDPRLKYSLNPNISEGEKISAVVIGTQLFRKGGMYAIQAFEKLIADGYDVELTLIGKFENSSYAFGDNIPNSQEWTSRAQSKDWIRFIPPVPHKSVYEELAKHDICLYPSLDESLGWLPIEAAMLGVPVVACNIGAFPEFVQNNITGLLIDIPLGTDGRWIGISNNSQSKAKHLNEVNDLIVKGIYESIKMYAVDKAKVNLMGAKARQMILPKYGEDVFKLALNALYSKYL